ncbi:MAG: T9SS type A sorting domain-containing protein, partial [bacterium]
LLFAGIIQAVTLPAKIDKAKIDMGTGYYNPSMPIVNVVNGRAHIIPVDSSTGEYSMWTQMHECLAYNPVVGGLLFTCRNFITGGNLDVWQSDSAFSFYVTDISVYSGGLGPARYPTSIASGDGITYGPHISFPYLIGGAWGGMGAQYESGAWFSSYWDSAVDVGPGDLNTHKNIGKQLPNNDILFIGVDTDDNIRWSTWNYQLDTMRANGIVAPAVAHYWGFDINGGIAYLFYYDDNLNIYYKTTTDGINWQGPFTYNMVWPNPYPTNNVIAFTQLAVTDAGNPILIFDNWHGDDYGAGNYPYRGKVYVSTASGADCIEVGNTATDARNFYPTVAAEGNYVVALFGQPRSGTGQYTFWDVYYNYSADNGVTWSTPRNLTSNITDHNNCLWQISKRLDSAGNGQLFFAFGCAIADPLLDLYWNINNGGAATPARWYVGRNPIVGIAENRTETPKKLALNIRPNPVRNETGIVYALPKSGNVSLKLYSADGRLLKTLVNGNKSPGVWTVNLNTSELANGTYFAVLKTNQGNSTKTMVVVH